ncbi:MAG: DUF5916 domain-containing protein [Cyclobacteriaceae bacterium]
MRLTYLLAICLLLVLSAKAQPQPDKYTLDIAQIDTPIKLDGVLDDEGWAQVDAVSDFMLNFPNDTLPPAFQTSVKMVYDNKNIYIAATMFEDGCKDEFVVSSLKRDFDFGENDLFVVYIDPFNDGTNGFTFNVSPFNVQREGLMFNGQRVNADWDNVWHSEAKIYDDKWVVEMAIPFKTLRFEDGVKDWKINFGRNDLKRNEKSTWVPVPINFWISSLAYTGTATFQEPLKRNGPNVSLIPYISSGVLKDLEAGTAADFDADAGFDAKIAVSSALNLDLTVNPDFSQVEVDRQQTNLNRFELFFPERRQFFLENNDLFAEFGFDEVRPFFSRRIGIAKDTADNTVSNRILAGARLSGKLNEDWRVGILNMQTQAENNIGVFANNYTVATIQRKVFNRSNISAIFVNRQHTGNPMTEGMMSGDTTSLEDDLESEYNRVLGVDYNLASADNTWRGKAFYHASISPENNGQTGAWGSELEYSVRKWKIGYRQYYVGDNYNSEVGFTPRKNVNRLSPKIEYIIYPKSGSLVSHGPELSNTIISDSDFDLTDHRTFARYGFNFKNTSEFRIMYFTEYVKLRDPFDPSGGDGVEYQTGESFRMHRYGIGWESDARKLFSYEATIFNGEFYTGSRLFMRASANYRLQPFANFSVDFEYNKVRLPEPYNDADLFLIGPRVDISFTDKLFLSSLVQYNSQIENININTRFQWRFKPVSDLFIVYTDNYLPENLKSKNRALVFKISYWLNL